MPLEYSIPSILANTNPKGSSLLSKKVTLNGLRYALMREPLGSALLNRVWRTLVGFESSVRVPKPKYLLMCPNPALGSANQCSSLSDHFDGCEANNQVSRDRSLSLTTSYLGFLLRGLSAKHVARYRS